ncbi:MAG: insulinase family protein [candidate division Zixibacteria bacterium]|nr:insulinase family protein [candidate division Zixibacteria bacterium]
MRKKIVVVNTILIAFLLFLTSSNFRIASAQEIKLPEIKKEILDNGLKVIVIEHHELPVVAFRLVLKSGSAYDPAGKAGLADLTAGLLRKGTKTKDATQISEAIDFVGGSLDAGADWDATFATCRVLNKYFDTGLDLLTDIILNPTFKEDEIERLRRQTLAGIMQQKDDPGSVAEENFRKFVFGEHPYGQPREGTEESVSGITREDIVNFHKTYYVPNNAILAVVGDVKTADVLKKVKSKFGSWEKREFATPNFVQPPQIKGHQILLVDKPDLTQSYVKIGHFGIDRKSPDYFPVRVMNYILGGGGFASRLMDEVRAKRGLTYDIGCNFDSYKLKGAFEVSTYTRIDSTLGAIQAVLDQIKRIRTEKVSQKELSETQSFYDGYFPLQFETPEQIATQILNVEIYDLGEDYIKNFRKNISAVTADDILRVAQKYLDPDNIKLVVVSKAEEVKPKLESLGEVEVTSFLK